MIEHEAAPRPRDWRAYADEPSPGFDLRVVESGGMVLGRVAGPLDVEHAPEFLARLQALCDTRRRLVVDLRRADYVDSAGVRALLKVQELLEPSGGELRLVVLPGSRVERTLRLLQLLQRFRVYESASAAWGNRSRAA
jgi:anti-anti-sigma factor